MAQPKFVSMAKRVKCSGGQCNCNVSKSSDGVDLWKGRISAAAQGQCHITNLDGNQRRIKIAITQLSKLYCADIADQAQIEGPTAELIDSVIAAGIDNGLNFWTPIDSTGVATVSFAPEAAALSSRPTTAVSKDLPAKDLSIRAVKGLGPRSEQALNNHKVSTVGQLLKKSTRQIQNILDKEGVDQRSLDPEDWLNQAEKLSKKKPAKHK